MITSGDSSHFWLSRVQQKYDKEEDNDVTRSGLEHEDTCDTTDHTELSPRWGTQSQEPQSAEAKLEKSLEKCMKMRNTFFLIYLVPVSCVVNPE